MAVLLLAALVGAGAPEARAAAKTLVVGLVAEPTSMDPGQLTDINSMRVLSSVYDTLVRFKEGSFTQEPGLATSWKMSPDGLTYTFTLRKNVKFHDGTPFDADAVKFTYDRLLDPKHPQAETGPFPFASFYYGAIKEVTVVDPGTVRFTLKQPFSPLLNNLDAQHRAHREPDRGEEVRQGVREPSGGHRPVQVRVVGQERAHRAGGERRRTGPGRRSSSASCSGRWWRSRPG